MPLDRSVGSGRFYELRLWVPLTPMMALLDQGEPVIVRCRVCGRSLAVELQEVASPRLLNETDGQDHIPRGAFCVSDGSFFTGSEGKIIVNVDVAERLVKHADAKRWTGCCGSDGLNGRNLLCACGREVGTIKSDCWMPYAILLDPDAVQIVREGGEA